MATATSIPWASLVRQADKNFDKDNLSPIAYRFPNHDFKDRNPVYGTNTSTET